MKTMQRVLLGIVVGLALYQYGRCSGAADARLSLRDDAHVRRVDSLERAETMRQRVEDSLRLRVVVAERAIAHTQGQRVRIERRVDTLRVTGDTAALVAGLDSVISGLKAENRHLGEQVMWWRALYQSADSGRTLLHHALHESEALREAWKRKAQRRVTCGVGPGLTVSLGGRSMGGATVACVVRL